MGGIVGYDPHAYSRRTPRGDDSGSGSGNSGPRQGQAGPAGAAGLLEKLRRTANRRGNPAATPYTPASPAPAGTANRANYDPYLKRHAERVEDRLDNFGASTGRAIDQAVGKVRDLGFGQKKAGQQAAAASGLLGTSSIPQFQGRQIDAAVMQQGAGVAADVALGRERDYDSLLAEQSQLAQWLAEMQLALSL